MKLAGAYSPVKAGCLGDDIVKVRDSVQNNWNSQVTSNSQHSRFTPKQQPVRLRFVRRFSVRAVDGMY